MSAGRFEARRSAVYEIAGRRFDTGSPGFEEAIARAHATHQRPRCVCRAGGIETYVARLNDSYVIKRMPETGNRHASTCPHFEPAADESGSQQLGSAIHEDPITGITTLKVDFSLMRSAPCSTLHPTLSSTPQPGPAKAPDSARSDQRLSLHGLLLYLWDQAGLTYWHPSFAGRRTWAVVRRRLLQAASYKVIGGRPLLERLYLPEPFTVEDREAISRRRIAAWSAATSPASSTGQLLLLIGELKAIASGNRGFKLIVKQVPDLAFRIEDRLYRQGTKRLQPTLERWNAANDIRMVIIGTFAGGATNVPSMVDLALVPTAREWIPVKRPSQHEPLRAPDRTMVRWHGAL